MNWDGQLVNVSLTIIEKHLRGSALAKAGRGHDTNLRGTFEFREAISNVKVILGHASY